MSGSSRTGQETFGGRPYLILPFVIGFVAVLFGVYWDDGWHTVRGRDSFWIAPHLVLYAGTTLAALTIVAWGAAVIRTHGVPGLRARPSLVLGALGAAATLGSAPIDDLWHRAFGRDAVGWSPPHMLGAAGLGVLAAAVTLEVSRDRSRRGVVFATLAGAALMAAATGPVFEYETDVPQFDEAWYLPVLALGCAWSMGLLRSVASARYAVTAAAAVYTAFRAIDGAVLDAIGFPVPLLPLLVAPGFVIDVTAAARWGPAARAAALVAALYAAYVPYLNWVRDDLRIDAADVAIGVAPALAAAYATFRLIDGPDQPRRPARTPAVAAVVLAAVALALIASPAALAHDPGQGPEVGRADVVGRVVAGRARLDVTPVERRLCRELSARAVVARRAGVERRADLRRRGCTFVGRIELPDRGRWFVYGQFADRSGERVETWLPLRAPDQPEPKREERSVYRASVSEAGALQVVSGVAMYLAIAVLLASAIVLYRRQRTAAAS